MLPHLFLKFGDLDEAATAASTSSNEKPSSPIDTLVNKMAHNSIDGTKDGKCHEAADELEIDIKDTDENEAMSSFQVVIKYSIRHIQK